VLRSTGYCTCLILGWQDEADHAGAVAAR
jgi:hypothetical protein